MNDIMRYTWQFEQDGRTIVLVTHAYKLSDAQFCAVELAKMNLNEHDCLTVSKIILVDRAMPEISVVIPGLSTFYDIVPTNKD